MIESKDRARLSPGHSGPSCGAVETRASAPSMEYLAQAMPWVLSLLFHLGLFLVMLFLMFVMIEDNPVEEIVMSQAALVDHETHFAQLFDPSRENLAREKDRRNRPTVRPNPVGAELTARPTRLIAVQGLGLPVRGHDVRPSAVEGRDGRLFGQAPLTPNGRIATNVVYVIDRSGSMADTFDAVRDELILSLARLREDQYFHVVFFSDGRPIENSPKRLVSATCSNKKAAVEFLQDIIPCDRTNPIPALERAFSILAKTRKGDSAVFLLTDGVFPENQAVLDLLRRLNAGGRVSVSTFLYGSRPSEAQRVLQAIAREHHGNYRFVPVD